MNQFDTKELPEFGMWSYDADSERLCWSDELFLMLGHAPQSFTPSADDLIAVFAPENGDAEAQAAVRSVFSPTTMPERETKAGKCAAVPELPADPLLKWS